MANTETIEYVRHEFTIKRKRWIDFKDWETDFKEGCQVKHVDEPQEKYKFVEINPKNDDEAIIVSRQGMKRTVFLDSIVRKHKPEDEKKNTKVTKARKTRKKRKKKKRT